jgi:hypothetical protein
MISVKRTNLIRNGRLMAAKSYFSKIVKGFGLSPLAME